MNETIKALLIEDDKPTADEIKDHLNSTDYVRVIGVAEGGTEALEILGREKPPLVILDINLRESHGVLFAGKIYEGALSYKPCIMVVTSDRYEANHQMLRVLGAAVVIKKYDDEYSLETITEWIKANRELILKEAA